jgi:hypothetical protein
MCQHRIPILHVELHAVEQSVTTRLVVGCLVYVVCGIDQKEILVYANNNEEDDENDKTANYER